ncbi:MAG: pyridoxine 5'-phosphate synthase, partial [Deltaproteobacteria bacterium]|nr:pyridoxine 5'-phosphate synthase [Deltaproteobacteria bacterium]
LRKFIGRLRKNGVVVSIFVDPDPKQIELCGKSGAERIEIHTGFYCDARGGAMEREFERIKKSAKKAAALGLGVAAGHGLDYRNVERILTIPEIDELNIGHSIVSRAVFVGIERAVKEMKEILRRGEGP